MKLIEGQERSLCEVKIEGKLHKRNQVQVWDSSLKTFLIKRLKNTKRLCGLRESRMVSDKWKEEGSKSCRAC